MAIATSSDWIKVALFEKYKVKAKTGAHCHQNEGYENGPAATTPAAMTAARLRRQRVTTFLLVKRRRWCSSLIHDDIQQLMK
jgi:hypothetical protein